MNVCIEAYLFEGLMNAVIDRNGTPYIQVDCNNISENREFSVPTEYIGPDGSITFNINVAAVSNFTIDRSNGYVMFAARFRGISRSIVIPVEKIMFIFAKEESIPHGLPMTLTIFDDLNGTVPPKPEPEKSNNVTSLKRSPSLRVVK